MDYFIATTLAYAILTLAFSILSSHIEDDFLKLFFIFLTFVFAISSSISVFKINLQEESYLTQIAETNYIIAMFSIFVFSIYIIILLYIRVFKSFLSKKE